MFSHTHTHTDDPMIYVVLVISDLLTLFCRSSNEPFGTSGVSMSFFLLKFFSRGMVWTFFLFFSPKRSVHLCRAVCFDEDFGIKDRRRKNEKEEKKRRKGKNQRSQLPSHYTHWMFSAQKNCTESTRYLRVGHVDAGHVFSPGVIVSLIWMGMMLHCSRVLSTNC